MPTAGFASLVPVTVLCGLPRTDVSSVVASDGKEGNDDGK
jgi:hypothetical protein